MGPGMGAAMSDQFRQHMEAAGPMVSEHLGKTRDRHGFTSFSLCFYSSSTLGAVLCQ